MFDVLNKLMKQWIWVWLLAFLGLAGCSGHSQIHAMKFGTLKYPFVSVTAELTYAMESPLLGGAVDAFLDGLLEGPPAPDVAAIADEVAKRLADD